MKEKHGLPAEVSRWGGRAGTWQQRRPPRLHGLPGHGEWLHGCQASRPGDQAGHGLRAGLPGGGSRTNLPESHVSFGQNSSDCIGIK